MKLGQGALALACMAASVAWAQAGGDTISFELDGEQLRATSWSWRVEDR